MIDSIFSRKLYLRSVSIRKELILRPLVATQLSKLGSAFLMAARTNINKGQSICKLFWKKWGYWALIMHQYNIAVRYWCEVFIFSVSSWRLPPSIQAYGICLRSREGWSLVFSGRFCWDDNCIYVFSYFQSLFRFYLRRRYQTVRRADSVGQRSNHTNTWGKWLLVGFMPQLILCEFTRPLSIIAWRTRQFKSVILP